MYRPYKGEVPRTLLDGISQLNIDRVIAVGSDTAYIFIGTVAEFYRDIDILDTYYFAVRKTANRYGNHHVCAFAPFMERAVRDMFYRQTSGEPEILVFLVTGAESGKIWLMNEYPKAREEISNALEAYKRNKGAKGK